MTYLDYCKPCHKYYDNTYLLHCECGHRMCKGCWLDHDFICPMCETDHHPDRAPKA